MASRHKLCKACCSTAPPYRVCCTASHPLPLLSNRVEAKAHKLDQYRKEAHEVRQLEQDLSLDYPHGLPVSLLLPSALLLHANVTNSRSNLGWCVRTFQRLLQKRLMQLACSCASLHCGCSPMVYCLRKLCRVSTNIHDALQGVHSL